MSSLLDMRQVNVAYGQSRVVHDLDLSVIEGEITTLLGANGAGKTTVLRAISNMHVRVSGEIRFSGQRIDGWQTEDIVRLGIGHVPEGRGTITQLTVEENLTLGACTRGDRNSVAGDLERVYSYFPRLKERGRQQSGTLSGGEQQMLAIGRALMLKPKFLLLDEPSFGLAPLVVREIFGILRRINMEDAVSILLVEQNASLALDLARDVYLLETGRVVLNGPTSIVKNNASVRRAYLGY